MFQLFIGAEYRNDSRCWKCTCLQIYEFMKIMNICIYIYNKLTNSNTYIDMCFSVCMFIYIYIYEKNPIYIQSISIGICGYLCIKFLNTYIYIYKYAYIYICRMYICFYIIVYVYVYIHTTSHSLAPRHHDLPIGFRVGQFGFLSHGIVIGLFWFW